MEFNIPENYENLDEELRHVELALISFMEVTQPINPIHKTTHDISREELQRLMKNLKELKCT